MSAATLSKVTASIPGVSAEMEAVEMYTRPEDPAGKVSLLSISRAEEVAVLSASEMFSSQRSTEFTAKMPAPVEPVTTQFRQRTSPEADSMSLASS